MSLRLVKRFKVIKNNNLILKILFLIVAEGHKKNP